jgi:hypothetical protein
MQTVSGRPERLYASGGVQRRPLLSASVHPNMNVIYITSFARRDAAVQGQPERSHLSWQAGLRAKAEASAKSESQTGAARSAAPDPSGRAAKPGAASFPDVYGPSAGANRARPGRTSGGGGRAGAARGSRRRPRYRMAGDRKPTGREPTSCPPAVPAPPPRRWQPRRWAGLTRTPAGSRCKASVGARKHVLSAPECHGSAVTRDLTSRNVSGPTLDNTCCRKW